MLPSSVPVYSCQDQKWIKYWQDNQIYHQLEEKNRHRERFQFVDGPPFVNNANLHYGHLLISTIKSSILNLRQMQGRAIDNKIGYDCHGLPIEMVVNELLGVKTKDDILRIGIDTYNAKCKELIHNFAGGWQQTFNQVGRFLDYSNEYKTMDLSFMETCWWVFGQLWKKNLVYRGYKIMPYSTGCCTPLSNFEASGLDNYKEICDPAVVVQFGLQDEPDTWIFVLTSLSLDFTL